MTKFKLEYIWLDGYQPIPNLRSKTQVKELPLRPSSKRCRSGVSTAARPGRPTAATPTAC